MADLYDHPKAFYELAVVTDGKFDPQKAAELGYNKAQFGPIKEYLGLENDTKPLPPVEK